LASLIELLKASPLDDWGFLHHVDMPVWEPGLFEILEKSACSCESPCEAVVPIHKTRRGHPILLSPTLNAPILGLDPARDRLDHWLQGRRIKTTEVPFACVLENWNGGPAALMPTHKEHIGQT
jgi:CTP:molybdopterin cytidylyltransferase MocA